MSTFEMCLRKLRHFKGKTSKTPTLGEMGFPYTYTKNRLIYFHAPRYLIFISSFLSVGTLFFEFHVHVTCLVSHLLVLSPFSQHLIYVTLLLCFRILYSVTHSLSIPLTAHSESWFYNNTPRSIKHFRITHRKMLFYIQSLGANLYFIFTHIWKINFLHTKLYDKYYLPRTTQPYVPIA